MQEGTSSLMQMAKVAVAVEALHQAHLPFISGEWLSDQHYPHSSNLFLESIFRALSPQPAGLHLQLSPLPFFTVDFCLTSQSYHVSNTFFLFISNPSSLSP